MSEPFHIIFICAVLATHSRDERITSAIHIINTLKSVNDTALSDWRGVIGDFIDEKRDSILEQQEDREEALKDILDRIEILHESQKGQNIGQGLIQRDIKENIELLQNELKILATALVGSPLKLSKGQRISNNRFEKVCPSCNKGFVLTHRKKKGNEKYIKCPHCQEILLSTIDDNLGHLDREAPPSGDIPALLPAGLP